MRNSPYTARNLAFACLFVTLLGACKTAPQNPVHDDILDSAVIHHANSGTLFIAGGAVDPRSPVLPRFFREAEKAARRRGHEQPSIEIIPVASGDPAGSLLYNWENFRSLAPTLLLGGLPISHDNEETATDPAVAKRLTDASALWFTGGDQSRITALFEPELRGPHAAPPWRKRRAIEVAAQDMLEAGGLIGGSSAGAAMMGDPMISGGKSEGALLFGEATGGVRTKTGMGYFPFGLVDQHFIARGRVGRLLVAMAVHSRRFGYGVEENSAIIATLGDDPLIEVVGQAGLCVLDLGPDYKDVLSGDSRPFGAEQMPEVWKFELSLLGTGDKWDPHTGKAIPNPDRVPLQPIAAAPAYSAAPLEPWATDALEKSLQRLSLNPGTPQVLVNEVHKIELATGPHTKFLFSQAFSGDLFASRVQVKITKFTIR